MLVEYTKQGMFFKSELFKICCKASMPSTIGMLMSVRITSGLSFDVFFR